MQTSNILISNWTWFDLILWSIIIWSFLLGIFLYSPYMIYKSIEEGKKNDWNKKIPGTKLETETPKVKLLMATISMCAGIYVFFIEGYFYSKYWDKVLLFFNQ